MKRCVMILALLLCLSGCGGPEQAIASSVQAPELSAEQGTALDQPPELMVSDGQQEMRAMSGPYTWGKEGMQAIACGMHPLDASLRADTPKLETETGMVTLTFSPMPDSITACCWSEDNWGNIFAPSEAVTVEDGILTLKSGGYIYQVTAGWSSQEDYGGSGEYTFWAVAP